MVQWENPTNQTIALELDRLTSHNRGVNILGSLKNYLIISHFPDMGNNTYLPSLF